jgi:hypothetical protein
MGWDGRVSWLAPTRPAGPCGGGVSQAIENATARPSFRIQMDMLRARLLGAARLC